jgi:hypothetical protein
MLAEDDRVARSYGRNYLSHPALDCASLQKSVAGAQWQAVGETGMFALGNRQGLALALLCVGLGASEADAFVGARAIITAEGAATPVAMCGRSCRSGGRFIPGPPRVCFQNGLEYCGPSDGVGRPGGVVVVPYGRERRGGFDGRRDGMDGRRDGIDGRRDGIDGRRGAAQSQDNTPCRQRLTNNKGEGYWGPGRNCDQGR